MKIAVLPFSGDPITYGHIDMLKRALTIFDHIVVAIGTNIDKTGKYLFTQEERVFLTRKVLEPFGDRVTVSSFTGLLTDFAYKNNIKIIIRGSRGVLDSAFEQMVSDVNRASNQGIETVLMFSDQKLSHISSSSAKEIQKNFGLNILDYVPMVVKQALEEKLNNQRRIGVTGEIGAGKSKITEELMAMFGGGVHTANNIDLDLIGKEILTKAREPVYVLTREALELMTDEDISAEDGFIDVKKLGSIIFSDAKKRDEYNTIMRAPIYLMLRERISSMTGIVFINSALLAEADALDFVNNNVILVKADESVRIERLKKRGYSDKEVKARMAAQLSANEKLHLIEESIGRHGHGQVVVYENSGKIELKDLGKAFKQFDAPIFGED